MPKDISKPRWVCLICGECFETDHDAAQRCEGAGPPQVLPDGTLLLKYDQHGPQTGWHLAPLAVAGRIKTRASHYNTAAGHFAVYQVGGMPADNRPELREGDAIWPHQPGVVQVFTQAYQSGLGGLRASTGGVINTAGWAAQLAGLDFPAAEILEREHLIPGLHRGVCPARVRPILAEIRAVFEILGASLDEHRRDYLSRSDIAAVLAAEQASRRDGLPASSYDPARLGWVLARADRAELASEGRTRQEAWLYGRSLTTGQPLPDGHGDLAPAPRLQSSKWRGGGTLTRTKLRKAEQEAVAATGVPWPERYSATDYLNLLVREALEIPMTSTASDRLDSELFSTVSCKVAVTSGKGGVGKTTTAGALASAMARELGRSGQWVWLVDLNLPNPGQHVLWGLGPVRADNDAGLIYGTEVHAGLRVFSHAQLAPGGRPDCAVIPVEKAAEWIAFLAGVLDLRGCGAIVFDLPPGWDSVHKVIFDDSRVGLTGVVHVTTGHQLAVGTETFSNGDARNNTPRRWLVENLSRAEGLLTDGSGRTAAIRLYGTGDAAVRDLAGARGLSYAGSLPWDASPASLAGCPEIRALAAALTTAAAGATEDA
jgi:Mrp family chromosome partitioning ATPase